MNRQITILLSPRFEKRFKKLPVRIQKLTAQKDKLFRDNPWSKQLKTHKLKGSLDGFWSYSISQNYRVLFRFINDCEVLYYDIGTHSIYL